MWGIVCGEIDAHSVNPLFFGAIPEMRMQNFADSRDYPKHFLRAMERCRLQSLPPLRRLDRTAEEAEEQENVDTNSRLAVCVLLLDRGDVGLSHINGRRVTGTHEGDST